jgi:hypothetical protein
MIRNKLKIIYIIFLFIVILLHLIQWPIHRSNPFSRNDLFENIFECSWFLSLGWFYMTGILIIIKSILLFEERGILLGVMLFLTGLLILIFTRYIVSFLFILIYGTE